jgi:ABC-type cobalamin/Fe3+-siderophores transport system ATPase subunit
VSGERELVAAAGLGWSTGRRRILGPLDLAVRAGECLVVVGPNGAGKTRLLRLLAGLLAPSAGSLTWRGEPYAVLSRRELARRVAYVPQDRPDRVPLTVEQLVLQGRFPHLRGLRLAPRAEDFAAVERALERTGTRRLRGEPMDRLSGGERQAAFIAAALAQEAPLLVLDEPTTHLDPRHQLEVAGLVAGLARDEARAVVLATHDLTLACLVGERIVALRDGAVLAEGPPAELVRPELLGRLFEAPFAVLEAGGRPVPILELPR